MTNNTFNKIVNQIKSMSSKEYNRLLEESKEMEKDYYEQLNNTEAYINYIEEKH